jgi:hypothetical protein
MWTTIAALFAKSPFARHALSILLAVSLGAGLFWYFGPPRVVIVDKPGPIQERTVYVDKPVLTEKTIVKYLPAPSQAEVEKILAENKALKNQVIALNNTLATLATITMAGKENPTKVEPVPDPKNPAQMVNQVTFKDWRLDFKSVGNDTTYKLTQRFSANAVVTKDVDGKLGASVSLFEVGPKEERTPITNTKVTSIVADPGLGAKHWFFSPSIQAGFAYTYDLTTKKSLPGGVIGLKWLTRGYTKAAEDGIYSILTPVAFISSTVEPGVLPVMVNLGRIPHQPFKDLWVGPLVGFTTKGGMSRYGVVFTGTF